MKPEDINWDAIPKQYDRVVQGAFHVWAMNDDERYLLVNGAPGRVPHLEVGHTFKNSEWAGQQYTIATRPVEDKAEYWIKRTITTGLSGPFTRAEAIAKASKWAKANHTSYTITCIIPVLEVSVGDVVVKEL